MDDLLSAGSNIIESMRDQRSVLKGARKKIVDIAGTLGLSNTTMRMIEKRAAQDKVLLIAGMVITLLVVVLTVKFILWCSSACPSLFIHAAVDVVKHSVIVHWLMIYTVAVQIFDGILQCYLIFHSILKQQVLLLYMQRAH